MQNKNPSTWINHLIAEYVEYRTKTTEFSSQSSRAKDKKMGTFLLTLFTSESSSNACFKRDKKKTSKQDFKQPSLSQMLQLKIPFQISSRVCACVLMMMGSLNFMASRMQECKMAI